MKSKATKLLLKYFPLKIIFLCTFFAGCSSIVSHEVEFDLASASSSSKEHPSNKKSYQKEMGVEFYFWGLYPAEYAIRSSELCKKHDKLNQVTFGYTGYDYFFSVLTLGIYYPKTLLATCGESNA